MAPEKPCLEEDHGLSIGHVFSLSSSGVMRIKEEEGAAMDEPAKGEDDDLTSLSWLVQNKNLLKGINLKPGAAQTSPTSDFAEDGSSGSERSERGESTCSSTVEPSVGGPRGNPLTVVDERASLIPPKLKHPHHIPYDPLVHINSKPPYSFSCLIFMAIEDSPARALPVKEIYAWIQSHFPFYRNAPTGWKNSVRHNLSLNKCFCKVEKAPNLGKGSLWMVDPAFRPNLLQSMSKAPVNSFSFLERCSVNNPSSPVADIKTNGSALKLSPSSKAAGGKMSHLPNPELFPFLSRRLAASGVELPGMSRYGGESVDGDSEDDEDADDVGAANAMLTLKHGPRLILPKDDVYKRSYSRKGVLKSSLTAPVITNSPSEDHTYSAGPNLSPDEAYGEGSDTDEGTEITPDHLSYSHEFIQSEDTEEQRRIAEGAADALLNLAGLRSKQTTPLESVRTRSRPPRLLSGVSHAQRARRQRQSSHSSDTPRPQQLRSNRKREKMAMEQDQMDRQTLMKAEIMADLEVIRNNNNIVNSEEFPKGSSPPHSRLLKPKEKRKLQTCSKQISQVNYLTRVESGAARNVILDKKINGSQKRKHWSQGENSLRKGRR